jgi:hypothetical protein
MSDQEHEARSSSGGSTARAHNHVPLKQDGNNHGKPVIHAPGTMPVPKQHQRAPEAGPSEDDRFGPGAVAVNARAPITHHEASGRDVRITIGLGKQDGVYPGMEGYIVAGTGMLADFQIDHVGLASYATVDLGLEDFTGPLEVVVNPTSKPASSEPQRNMSARIIGILVQTVPASDPNKPPVERLRVLIGLGTTRGARAGQRGVLEGVGGPIHFQIAEQYPRTCVAYLTGQTFDVVRHMTVRLNP